MSAAEERSTEGTAIPATAVAEAPEAPAQEAVDGALAPDVTAALAEAGQVDVAPAPAQAEAEAAGIEAEAVEAEPAGIEAEAVEAEAAGIEAEAVGIEAPASAVGMAAGVPEGIEPDVDSEAAGPTPEPAVQGQPSEPVVASSGPAPFDELAHAPAASEVPLEPAAAPEPRREPTTMEELLSEQAGEIRSLKHGDVVEGTVVRIDKDEMLVDIGAKSEGVVSNRELYGRNTETQPQLSVGDTVLVYVLQPESQEGHAVLSLRRAGLERKWRAMQEQFDAGVVIEAPVIDHNKGGLIVDCGIRGFVPISQIVDFPRRPQNDQPRDAAQEIAEKLQPYVGRRLRLKILEVNRKANRLILSEKVALYEERREKRDELFSSLTVGQRVSGTVRSIAPFGVFIDLGGIDGLVHKSELSWNKVNNPEAGYQVGEEVEAEVIDINHERGRISLSIRRLQPDPWQSSVADLKVGDIVDGTVTKIVNFGAFVRVRDGLEGLIHISELSHQRVAHPGDVVHEGQTIKLKVISLDSERHRLGLSLKQAEEAPQRVPEPPRERRPRTERAYDATQAIQEPEGGIDNTLAAAFAQVRQQVAEQEAAAHAAAGPVADRITSESDAADEVALAEVAEAVAADDAAQEAVAEAIEARVLAEEAVIEAVEAVEAAEELGTAEAVAEAAEAEGVAAEAVAEAIEAEAIAEEALAEAEEEAVEAEAAVAEAMSDGVVSDEVVDAVMDALILTEEELDLDDEQRSALSAGLGEINGVEAATIGSMEAAGIVTLLDLLQHGATRRGREALAAATGHAPSEILRLVNNADLRRVHGVGTKYADLLEASGVDTVVELAARRPDNLTARMIEINEQRSLVERLPTEEQVEGWVGHAGTLPRVVRY